MAHQKNPALAVENAWWDVGHALNEASGVLDAWIESGECSDCLIVGEAAARLIDPEGFGYVWRRRLIAEMLYAFAVEDWLKGLLVAGYERGSAEKRRKIRAMISERMKGSEGSALDEEFVHKVIATMKLESIQAQITEHDKERHAEDSARVAATLEHLSHDLVRLATAAGLTLDVDTRKYLRMLSVVNQLGRYPALMKGQVGNIEILVGNRALRAKLNSAIKKRYEAILSTKLAGKLGGA